MSCSAVAQAEARRGESGREETKMSERACK